jgi:hypothetical protein
MEMRELVAVHSREAHDIDIDFFFSFDEDTFLLTHTKSCTHVNENHYPKILMNPVKDAYKPQGKPPKACSSDSVFYLCVGGVHATKNGYYIVYPIA